MLSRELGLECWLKLEQLQHTGSFKVRGAFNRLLLASPAEREQDVVTASSGNHGLAVAFACDRLGFGAEVHVSQHASAEKLSSLRASGVRLVEHPSPDTAEAECGARQVASSRGALYVSPYNDIDVVAGQATLGQELIGQLPDLDAVVVAVGGGGLLSGVACAVKAVNPTVEVIGVWPQNSAALYYALRAGCHVDYPELPTLSDATAGGLDRDTITLPLASRLIDQTVLVSEEELLAAGRRLLQTDSWLVEPSAAVALAGTIKLREVLNGRSVCVILCGRNVSGDYLNRLISL